MLKSQAQQSIKNIQTEATNLQSSGLITLFEIDLSNALIDRNIYVPESERIFYFHNNTKLVNTDIEFQGKIYNICPIEATGFELSSQGTLPTPSLRMAVNDSGIPFLAILKNKIKLLGDLVGCKITRRRTFAKFLPSTNFDINNSPSIVTVDQYAEFPIDVWFFSRKVNENKNLIEYELNSILDLENIQLPRRLMFSKRCSFVYRGEGCLYEYDERRNDNIHGESSVLPLQAPPVATEEDKLISDILGVSITVMGAYQPNTPYQKGQSVFIEHNGIKYYFVAKTANVMASPPNPTYWLADNCSRCLKGCQLRWNGSHSVSPLVKGELPYGGFYGMDRIRA